MSRINKECDIIDPGKVYSGFKALSVQELSEYGSTALHFTHLATGLELFHLHNNDRENLFAFVFRTPPNDDTGVAHILEHSVLCGSERFPVKDPFVLLLKGSLHTFLNAFTFPDKTVYPASSMLEKDFYNLMLVYGDAVFSPLLKREVLMQEGHHLEYRRSGEQDGRLARVGVVYNEMKGALASAETLVGSWSFRSLFPDTPYGFESGGNPLKIPDLTYEELSAFFHKYYHPSNCRIFIYGSIPTKKHLLFLQENLLSSFRRRHISSEIPLQPRWDEPRTIIKTFPVGKEESRAGKSSIVLNWLIGTATDPLKMLSMEVLSEILLGNAGSPLRQALVESGLGEDISPASGLDTELKEMIFSAGLRGTDPERQRAIESKILDTLKDVAEAGFEKELLDPALHRIEFRHREIRRGGSPYALQLLWRSLSGWLHNTTPEVTLEFERWLKVLKNRIYEDKNYLVDLLVKNLLENPHQSTIVVKPDPAQSEREQRKEESLLKQVEKNLSAGEKQALVADNSKLLDYQNTPDGLEDLKKVPLLNIQDLPEEVEIIPTSRVDSGGGVPCYFHELSTRGIVYLDLVFSTRGLDKQESLLLPLLGRALCGCGLEGIPYGEVARTLALYSGGFTAGLDAGSVVGGEEVREQIIFRLKTLNGKLAPALKTVKDLLLGADFSDLDRLKDILLNQRNALKASLIPAGHRYAALRAGSRISRAMMVEEEWQGITQLLHLTELATGLTDQGSTMAEIAFRLQKLRETIINKSRLILNISAEKSNLNTISEALQPLLAELPAENAQSGERESGKREPGERENSFPCHSPGSESFVAPVAVGYVAQSLAGARFGTPGDAHQTVLANLLSTGPIWHEVRMKGGAYGAFASQSGLEGVFSFSSYRDPRIIETFRAYREALEYGVQGDIEGKLVEEAIISTIGSEEKPLAPGEKDIVALKRILYGINDQLRQQRRREILAVSRPDLAGAASLLLRLFDRRSSVVLASRKAIMEAGEELGELKGSIVELPL